MIKVCEETVLAREIPVRTGEMTVEFFQALLNSAKYKEIKMPKKLLEQLFKE